MKTILALVLLFGVLNAKESEAEKLCNAEIKKEIINISLVEEQCLKTANFFEAKENFEYASWYYLLSKQFQKNLDYVKDKIKKNFANANIAYSYILVKDYTNAEKYYRNFLKEADVPWADKSIKDDYKLLFKLYPNKKKQLQQGLKLWNEIYKPLLAVNELYPKYKKAKKYQDSIKYLSKIIEMQTNSHLQNELNIADNKFSLGVMHNNAHHYNKSLKIFFEVEKLYTKEAKKKDLTNLYVWIAKSYNNLQKYKKALIYYKKSLAINEKILGEEHISTAQSYNNIGGLYYTMEDYPKALSYYKKSLAIREKILGKTHISTAQSYNNIGALYQNMEDYPKALSYLKKSLAIYEKVLGKEHTTTAISYNNIGALYKKMEDYPKALSYFKKDLAISEKVLGKEHSSTATSYNNIGGLYNDMEDYPKALSYYKQSLVILEKVLGKEHTSTAQSYNNIGLLYNSMGDYPKSLSYYKKSLAIREKILGKTHISTAQSYNNIGALYQNMGDYPKALSYYKQSLAIREKVLGKEHITTAISYNNIGLLYQNMGDYPKTLSYYKKVSIIFEKVLGKEHTSTAISYNNIGGLYEKMRNYPKALNYYKKSLAITEKVLGKEHTTSATSYNNIGALYKKMGTYPKSLSYYKKSLAIRKKVLGENHADTATSYNNLSLLYKTMKDNKQAYNYAKKSYDIFIKNRDKNFQVLDNKQKKLYLKSNSNKIPLLLNTAYLYGKEEKANERVKLSKTTLSDWLNYKGAIYDSENAIVALYESTKDKALKAEIDELMQSKRNLARLYQTLPKSKEERATYQTRVAQSRKAIDELEKKISAKASSFKEELGLRDINYKDIAKNLKENELYVDYAKAGKYYYIFTLDAKENITFKRVDENATKSIDENVKLFREDIDKVLKGSKLTQEEMNKLQEHSKTILSKLYTKALREPLKEILPNYSSLIVSADGALRLLPFETMFNTKSNKYLIEEKSIRYIPSGKELVRLFRSKNKNPKEKVVLFDNPNFDAKDVVAVQTETLQTENTKHRAGIIKSLFKMRFSKLLGTKKEATGIKETLKNQEIQEFAQNQASEENLLKLESPKILHIATHGFFINDSNIPNPMLKSGIALSGANASAMRGKSDGIVTSLKLSGLHLKGTQLVVLSACQTGVVDINSTDNVSGLNKAFIQAGAKNIIMSLWSVSDNETSKLMNDFYKNTQQNADYANALRKAKLKMIEEKLHPFYWGAFIVSGV